MKHTLALLMVAVLTFGLLAPAALAQDQAHPIIEPFYEHAQSVVAKISITSGTATCKGVAMAVNSSDSIEVNLILQKKVGGKWTKVTAWPASGKGLVSIEKTHSLEKGFQYRARLTGSVTRNGVKEAIADTSKVLTY